MLLHLLLLHIFLLVFFSTVEGQEDYASCGDCHCIVTGDEACPTGDHVPQMIFSDDLVGFLQSLEATNPYNLSCNPYQDDLCDTVPPQSNLTALGDDAACGIVYETEGLPSDIDNQCPTRYNLVSYTSVGELDDDGAVLTHYGACGVCSTTQDLAVYIEHTDLADKGTECSLRGIQDFADGVACYQEVGYTGVSKNGQNSTCQIQREYMLTFACL